VAAKSACKAAWLNISQKQLVVQKAKTEGLLSETSLVSSKNEVGPRPATAARLHLHRGGVGGEAEGQLPAVGLRRRRRLRDGHLAERTRQVPLRLEEAPMPENVRPRAGLREEVLLRTARRSAFETT